MGLKQVFQKQGGMRLLRQYAQSGVLGSAIGIFIILGKSRTALEILRLSMQLKIKRRLEKKYHNILEEADKLYKSNDFHGESSNRVWICWFQGIKDAPEIVRKCYESVMRNLPDKSIVLITNENMYQYIQFPEYIQKKIDKGIIKGAHLSDLLRLELLLRYGGTWIDSTVFFSENNIPHYMLDSDLFMFQCLKPGRDGHSTIISNWFITAKPNNKLLWMTRELLYRFWKENDDIPDYFIFHVFFQMCIEYCPEEWNKVPPVSNSTPHILLLRFMEKYDERIWKAIKEQTPIHKLTYKGLPDIAPENSYYDMILHYPDNKE